MIQQIEKEFFMGAGFITGIS